MVLHTILSNSTPRSLAIGAVSFLVALFPTLVTGRVWTILCPMSLLMALMACCIGMDWDAFAAPSCTCICTFKLAEWSKIHPWRHVPVMFTRVQRHTNWSCKMEDSNSKHIQSSPSHARAQTHTHHIRLSPSNLAPPRRWTSSFWA